MYWEPATSLSDLLGLGGLSVSISRLAVLETLRDSPVRHLSAEQLSAALTLGADFRSGLSTFRTAVYELAGAGILSRVVILQDRPRSLVLFEMPDRPPHRHLYCQVCHEVEEVFDDVLEHQLATHLAEAGLVAASADCALVGTCAKCRAGR